MLVKEFTLKEFCKKYPLLACYIIPAELQKDNNYIVRVDFERNLVEFGYKSDVWNLSV